MPSKALDHRLHQAMRTYKTHKLRTPTSNCPFQTYFREKMLKEEEEWINKRMKELKAKLIEERRRKGWVFAQGELPPFRILKFD